MRHWTVRQRGKKIAAKGIYRDPVKFSHTHFVKTSALRWVCVALLVRIPCASRVWALPFLSSLGYSERYAKEQGKHWVCPVSTDCLPLSHGTSSQSNHFVICRAEVPECGVSASGVVETLDVLEDRRPGGLSLRPRVAVDKLSFESGDEALGHRVVVGIRYRSHRRE